MRDKTVLCAGHANLDIPLPVESFAEEDGSADIKEKPERQVGGAATNTAQVLNEWRDTHLLSVVGQDKEGDEVIEKLESSGVTPHFERGGETTVVYGIQTPTSDPRYYAYSDELSGFGINEVDDTVWQDVDHVHITSYGSGADEVAEGAKSAGKTVSFVPTQGYNRRNYETVVENADVVFLNENEAEIFRDRHYFAGVAEDTVIVTTQGSMGASVYSPDGVLTNPGYNIDRPSISDTIGAGDSFAAGFLHGWLSEDKTRQEELELANATGAYAVTMTGAPKGVNREFVRELVN